MTPEDRADFAEWLARLSPLIEHRPQPETYVLFMHPDDARFFHPGFLDEIGISDVMTVVATTEIQSGQYAWSRSHQRGSIEGLSEVMGALMRLSLKSLRLAALSDAMDADQPFRAVFTQTEPQPGDPEPTGDPDPDLGGEQENAEAKPEAADIVHALLSELQTTIAHWAQRFQQYL